MSPRIIRFLIAGACALQFATLPGTAAHADIIILADPNAPTLPVVIDPAMRGIILTGPPKDAPSVVRRQIGRAHGWADYKGNPPLVGGYYPYANDPYATPEIRTRAVVDYSLRRAHSYRKD